MYELMKFGGIVTTKIDEKVKQIEEDLAARSAKNYEEYCEQCGVVTGLLTARRFITDLTKNLENSDE
jgi:heterodisulfide reductase subunit C